jgi:anti-anti-sigma factor
MDTGGNDAERDFRVVRARGELDLVTAWDFGLDLLGVQGRAGNGFLVVDLDLVTFMDCSALRELCGARRQNTAAGGWTRLVYDQPQIHRLLTATRLSSRFPRYASVSDARSDVVALPLQRGLPDPDLPDRTPGGCYPLAG